MKFKEKDKVTMLKRNPEDGTVLYAHGIVTDYDEETDKYTVRVEKTFFLCDESELTPDKNDRWIIKPRRRDKRNDA